MRTVFIALCLLSLAACLPRAQEDNPVVTAVLANDAQKVIEYLSAGGDPDLKNRDGDALLYIGAGPKGGEAVVAALLAAGADPDGASAQGRTALANAVGWCDVEMVELLLENGADLELLVTKERTLYDAACQRPLDRRVETLRVLQEQAF